MNIFLIPSWYPSQTAPAFGSFTHEQAIATAELVPDLNIIVSTWGHSDSFIDHRSLTNALSALKWRTRSKQRSIQILPNFIEIQTPCLHWSDRLLSTSMPNLINANRKNLQSAISQVGGIDLIHAHVSYPGGHIARILAQELSIPYVITEHMSPFPFAQYLRDGQPRSEILTAMRQASATIAVSHSLATKIASFGLPSPTVIPNMVDERYFSLRNPDPSKFVFFTLCLMTAQKGIDHLLQSIAHWNPPAKEVVFRIGGDGPLLTEYQNLAQELGIADRIEWLGALSRQETAEQFKRSHAYVMPSRHETFGVVYAEAIACGKPIIATRCGGPESIVNDQNGVLVNLGDIPALSLAMRNMMQTWERYDAQIIRAHFMQHFSRKAVIDQLTRLYGEIANKDHLNTP